jgi:hypothetical protein
MVFFPLLFAASVLEPALIDIDIQSSHRRLMRNPFSTNWVERRPWPGTHAGNHAAASSSTRVEQVMVDVELDLIDGSSAATPVLQGVAAAVASSVPNAVGLRLKGVVGSLHGAVVVQGSVYAPPLTAITIEKALRTWTDSKVR